MAGIFWYVSIDMIGVVVDDPIAWTTFAVLGVWWFCLVLTLAAVSGRVPKWLTLGK